MSNKPKIHAFCAAGCKWETVHYSDFQKSAAFVVRRTDDDGNAIVDPLAKYRLVSGYIPRLETSPTTVPIDFNLQDMATAVVGNKVYFITGYSPTAKNCYDFMYEFDVQTKETKKLPDLEYMNYCEASAAAVGNYIYYFGGRYGDNYNDKIIRYNTETGESNTLSAKFYKALCRMAVATVGTKIYLFGGRADTTVAPDEEDQAVNTIHIFDTATLSLETSTVTLPRATMNMSAVAVGTKIYLFGGNDTTSTFDTIYVFDTETETISTAAVTLPTAGTKIAAAAEGTNIFLFYGEYVICFDTEKQEITTLSETRPTGNAKSTVAYTIGQEIYLFGSGNNDYEEVKIYTDAYYETSLALQYEDSGSTYEHTFTVGEVDKYRDYYDFEILALEANAAGSKVTVVYEVNGNRRTDTITGTNLDVSDAVLLVTSAARLLEYNARGEIRAHDGTDGKTPERGVDYWTEADKAEIKSYVDEAILGGAW